jgi:hypothetical protein
MKQSNFRKLVYKADINGDLTVEQQIIVADNLAFDAGRHDHNNDFKEALVYDMTRTIINILSNATIKFQGQTNSLCLGLQNNLVAIFFELYKYGYCYLIFDESGSIIDITTTHGKLGAVKIVDAAWKQTGITQQKASDNAMSMYEVVSNAMFSIVDERGVMGMFSPPANTDIKPRQSEKLADMFRTFFGAKKKQRKFAVSEIPMTYSAIPIPVEEMKLLENKKDATATVARIYGIQEDMILSGSTFDNKENAIIQTYSDYKGVIYNWITQIVRQRVELINPDNYDVTFPSVPQLNKPIIQPIP